jgi:hypothetical protein
MHLNEIQPFDLYFHFGAAQYQNELGPFLPAGY